MSSVRIGYARATTTSAGERIARTLITTHDCVRVFCDVNPDSLQRRDRLQQALEAIEHGDTLVLAKVSDACSTFAQLNDLDDLLLRRGAYLVSLSPRLDSSRPDTRRTLDDIAQLRLALRSERRRTQPPVRNGRPPALTADDATTLRAAYDAIGPEAIAAAMLKFGVSRATIYRALNRAGMSAPAERH